MKHVGGRTICNEENTYGTGMGITQQASVAASVETLGSWARVVEVTVTTTLELVISH